jgi:hypothetical protein
LQLEANVADIVVDSDPSQQATTMEHEYEREFLFFSMEQLNYKTAYWGGLMFVLVLFTLGPLSSIVRLALAGRSAPSVREDVFSATLTQALWVIKLVIGILCLGALLVLHA